MGVVEDRTSCYGILITAVIAVVQIALFAGFSFSLELVNVFAVASDAAKTLGPANALKVCDTSPFGRKLRDDLEYKRLCFVWFADSGLLHGSSMEDL